MSGSTYIRKLSDPAVELELIGGKSLNLVVLSERGFPVPAGFILTTTAYRDFVALNRLEQDIRDTLADLNPSDVGAVEAASRSIRARFRSGRIPRPVAEATISGWEELGKGPVAVRSSAIAEDLPGLSFAGQQESFLNVGDSGALLAAVRDCWSSLWTARAISYRARVGMAHNDVVLACIIQRMIPAEAAGVLFTANPVTGKRNEIVIDATLGLGEALVGGQVEPDHYVVNIETGSIQERTLGAKSIRMQPRPDGGLQTIPTVKGDLKPALSEPQILALAELGRAIAQTFGTPQDIEWALENDRLHILQSRPITSLYPLPQGMSKRSLRVLFSFGSVQGLLDPMTPLGQDAITLLFAGGASLFGFRVTHETQGAIRRAGERLWVDITPIIKHPLGRRLSSRLASGVDPGVAPHLESLLSEPELAAGRWRGKTFSRIVRMMLPLSGKVLAVWRRPHGAAAVAQRRSHAEIVRLTRAMGQSRSQLRDCIAAVRTLEGAFPFIAQALAPSLLAGVLPLAILHRLAQNLENSSQLALEATRGLPNNVTTEMDLALWQAARSIRADKQALQTVLQTSTTDLVSAFRQGQLPPVAQEALSVFIARYGMRGLAEIDLGRPRWSEQPDQIVETLRSYLQIDDPELAPDAVFARGKRAAQAALETLAASARQARFGRLKAGLVRWLGGRMRATAGLRESPKFHIIQQMALIRTELLACGRQLQGQGILRQADDIFYLQLDELEGLATKQPGALTKLIAQRRQRYRQETRRRLVPRLLMSDGRAYYEGPQEVGDNADTLQGTPASPGTVIGRARIIHDPLSEALLPGEILVCPATDPAWTPLFLVAGGLIMEMGGMMTHGAIVAREYGIPAVVGVRQATGRLRTGQEIRVDGASGRIVRLSDGSEQ